MSPEEEDSTLPVRSSPQGMREENGRGQNGNSYDADVADFMNLLDGATPSVPHISPEMERMGARAGRLRRSSDPRGRVVGRGRSPPGGSDRRPMGL